MTPWEHVREAERLADLAGATTDSADSVRLSHLALVQIELAKAKDLMAEPPLAKVRTVGRVYPLDAP